MSALNDIIIINTTSPIPTTQPETDNEALNIILAVSISVGLTLFLLLILIVIILYRKRKDCFLCASSKSRKNHSGSMDDINISTIGRYYDMLKSPMRKISLTVLSDRKSSNASRKFSESSAVPESNEYPRSNHIHLLQNHLCPPPQNYSPRSLGEDESQIGTDDDHLDIPHHISTESECTNHSSRLDQLRLLSHSAPIPRHKQSLVVEDDDSLGSPFSRSPRLDDREAIFGKPEVHVSHLDDEKNTMVQQWIILMVYLYRIIKNRHFGQSLEALNPTQIKLSDRNSYNIKNDKSVKKQELSSLNSSNHHQFRSEGCLLDSPAVPPKIAPLIPPKQTINKSKNEIQVITQELKHSTVVLKPLNNGEYEDYDDPSSHNNEYEDYDIPISRLTEE
ncbi:unnamed protein product [Lepeophtheirus salmonis]|uniref:(salmon louse) hypothetical protein n=1 Tax=Lepeophtheirus salmonis TaxID=72036 RepID=A0A7R8CVL8_LEPSM|nr:unnamed protein product [Lepeophtheirus salmonis]CAF2944423.1 unnamed protein product [Lepeophtheirus salmonis]